MDNDGWNQNSLNVLNNISAPEPWDSPPLIFSLEDKDGNPIQFDLSSALKQSVRGKSKKNSFKRSILQSAFFFPMSTFDNMSSTETKKSRVQGLLQRTCCFGKCSIAKRRVFSSPAKPLLGTIITAHTDVSKKNPNWKVPKEQEIESSLDLIVMRFVHLL